MLDGLYLQMIDLPVQLDPHDRFFEQENNIGFFTANLDPQPNTAGAIRRRVTAMFGDAEPEGDYHEPQKMTDDTLMDVCSQSPLSASGKFDWLVFRTIITIRWANWSSSFN